MPPYKFRLATLLRLREAARDERRAQLAEAQHAEELVTERVRAMDRELAELVAHAQRAARPGRIDVDVLADAQRYEMLLKAERQLTDQQRQQVVAEVGRRREALMVADRDVRVLEKLRETQLDRHRRDEGVRETKLLDEIASRRFGHEEAS